MRQKLRSLLFNRKLIYGLVLLAALTNGIAQTVITYDSALGMGDNSTFYAFTRNAADGEVMYKDFIHFRTPGTITLFAGIMKALGTEQSTLEISTRIETLVLYPLIALAATMIIFRKKNPWYVVGAFMGIALLPGVAQIRAAVGLLAIAVYLLTFENYKRNNLLLALTGFLASLTFFFGQEIAVMVGVCVMAGELLARRTSTELLGRIKWIAAGAAAGIVPLLLYMAVFSNIANFFYYTLYYSFILQPKFMNVPFPEFGYENLVYYLPFAMYMMCFAVLYFNKKLGITEGLLLSFGVLRLITATGRADFGHLIFSIPEVFIIVPYFLARAKEVEINRTLLIRFLPYGLTFSALLLASTQSGLALAVTPFVILLSLRNRVAKWFIFRATPKTSTGYRLYLTLGVLLAIFIFILTPTYLATARAIKHELITDDSQALRIGGVKTDLENYTQVIAVQAVVEPLKPKTVFAFPIQPFYYSLADHHASRFLTFEPQTTLDEQDQTISDLKRTKPEVIIFDPLQAQGLSGSLWKISDYIMSNYELKSEVAVKEILWVMVPRSQVVQDEKLAFHIFRDKMNKQTAIPIQSSDIGLQSAVAVNPIMKAVFNEDSDSDDTLVISVAERPGHGRCGVVKVTYSNNTNTENQVCTEQGEVKVPLRPNQQSIRIELHNPSQTTVIWNNPRIQ